ncbi:MAG: hypothetical protein JWM33_4022, partial [Caulobacteraceae bacterium]|nr:hypothetical protein [Caulobacteraceae bacterium]
MTLRRFWALAAVVSSLATLPAGAVGVAAPPGNPIEVLQQQINSGAVTLDYAPDGQGYMPSILKALSIPVDSQVLAFTRSSLQLAKISPSKPRAIYFNDNLSAASVLNGQFLEFLVNDPRRGLAFYLLDTPKVDKPQFREETSSCMFCHGVEAPDTPGWIVANIPSDSNGNRYSQPKKQFDFTDDRTPFEQRWGGWYVTGDTGSMVHGANRVRDDPPDKVTTNLTDLSRFYDLKQTLAPTSDVVALMTLAHQTEFSNLIVLLKRQSVQAPDKIDATVENLVAEMTYADAVPLPSPVKGSSQFAQDFTAAGLRDPKGRSLKEFDLKTRVFRYPLSYMVYSSAFDSLPADLKAKVWRRLYDVLSGADRSGDYKAVAAQGGDTAIAILAATKSGLPD